MIGIVMASVALFGGLLLLGVLGLLVEWIAYRMEARERQKNQGVGLAAEIQKRSGGKLMSGALKVARIVCERCEDKESDGCVNCIVRLAYDAEDDRLARIYRIECRETGRRFRSRHEHKRCQEFKQGRKRY